LKTSKMSRYNLRPRNNRPIIDDLPAHIIREIEALDQNISHRFVNSIKDGHTVPYFPEFKVKRVPTRLYDGVFLYNGKNQVMINFYKNTKSIMIAITKIDGKYSGVFKLFRKDGSLNTYSECLNRLPHGLATEFLEDGRVVEAFFDKGTQLRMPGQSRDLH
jgi:antitoxin component YwqK of YwqJK toxin-antitoxin module